MITVNHHVITESDVEAELERHQDADDPMMSAAQELTLRELLRQRATELGMDDSGSESALQAVLDREVSTPLADEPSCRRYYEQHLDQFVEGDSVELSHILFQLTPRMDPRLLRERAVVVLNELLVGRADFAQSARQYSNCPSGAGGGYLGVLRRGEAAPEFEQAVFRLDAHALAQGLVDTRYGFHIVRVGHKEKGAPSPFEIMQPQIAAWLEAASRRRAQAQYMQWLVGQARIQGIALQGADSPLVQ